MELYALIFQIVECIGIFFVNIFNCFRDFFSVCNLTKSNWQYANIFDK